MTSLLRRLGVAALSSDVAEQSVTDMYEPCPQVQLFAHKVVPLIQKMLYSDSESEHNNVYDRLKERGIKNKLAVIQFGQVKLNKKHHGLETCWMCDYFDVIIIGR